MTTVSQIVIEMSANVARLRQDMDAAKSTVSGAMDGIKSSVGTAMGALAGLGLSLSVIGAGKYLYGLVEDVYKAQAGLKERNIICNS